MNFLNIKNLDLENIIEFGPDPILFIQNNKFCYCNTAAAQLFQSDKSYILGKHPWEISPPKQECGSSSEEKALKILSSNFEDLIFEWLHLRPNGKVFPVEVKLSKKVGGIIHCSWRDITHKKKQQDAILDQQNLLNGILDCMAIPAFAVNSEGLITYWNKACETLTDRAASEMLGTDKQWEPFYNHKRYVLADIVAQQLEEKNLIQLYGDSYKRSLLFRNSFEAEGVFEKLGNKYLFFTASPLYNIKGEITGAIETFQDVTEKQNIIHNLTESIKEKEELAYKDKLTGLWNSRKLTNELCESVNQNKNEFCVAMIDADNFKTVNDNYGHMIGDIALSFIGQQIKEHIRDTDIAFRYGGEEFTVILKANIEEAYNILERIRRNIEETPFYIKDNNNLFIKISIGLTKLLCNDSDKSILERADKALYKAKTTGKNRTIVI